MELIGKPGDILGWYDMEASGVGFDFSSKGQVCTVSDVDKPATGVTIDSLTIVQRLYSIKVAYGK